MVKDKTLKAKINANRTEIAGLSTETNDGYISLTEIAKYKSDEPTDVIKNWL